MQLDFQDIGYSLRPYRDTCWQLYRWATDRTGKDGEPIPDAWVPLDFYPSTLEYGLRNIVERCARKSDARTLNAALAEIRGLTAGIVAVCERLQQP